MKYPFIAAAVLLGLSACRQQEARTASATQQAPQKPSLAAAQPPDPAATVAADSAGTRPDFRALNAVLRSLRAEPSAYLVSGTAPQTITGDKGVRLRIVPDDLETVDGQPVSGPIEVTMTEMTTAADFILNGAPTMSGGRLLESGGAVDIRCTAGGKALRIKKGRMMEIAFPKTDQMAAGMQAFYGQRDAAGLVDWTPAGKGSVLAAESDTVSWDEQEVRVRDSIAATGRYEGERITAERMRNVQGLDINPDRRGVGLLEGNRYRSVDTLTVRNKATAGQKMMYDAYNVLRTSQLGLINHDRFYGRPTIALAVTVPAGEAPALGLAVVIFRDINSVLQTNLYLGNTSGSTLRLPENTKARLVVLRAVGKKLYGFSQDINTEADRKVAVTFQPISDAEMRQLLTGKG